jgi:hypothetical protein
MSLLPLSSATLPSALSILKQAVNPFATQQSHTRNTGKMSCQEQQDRRNARLQTLATEVSRTHTTFEESGDSPNTFPPATNCDSQTRATPEAWTEYMNAKNALGTEMIVDQKIHHLPTPTDLYVAGNHREKTGLDGTLLQMCDLMRLDPTLCNKTSMRKYTKGKPEYSELHQALEAGKWP